MKPPEISSVETATGAAHSVAIVVQPFRKAFPRAGTECIALFLICFGLSWRSGLLRSEFGRYQDEGMHYITGLFVQDFLTSGQWSNPMRFAQQYYLHLPKVALGNWPPGFPLMQAAWGLVFGVSRISMLFGMIVLTTWLAFLVYREGRKYFGPVWGVLGAILLIAAPLTQEQTAMVMAEIPLAAASFLAIAGFVRFIDSTRPRDAVRFALWTICAIMIKGNGWVITLAAPLILLFTGRLRLVRNVWLWIAALLVAVVCIPYTLITMHIVTQGWDTRTFPGLKYVWASLGIHLGFVVHLLGIPMTALAVIGAAASLFSRRDTFWKAMVIYSAAIILFHVAIPSSIEPRKVYQITPALCLLVLAGLEALAGVFPAKLARLPVLRPSLAVLAGLAFFLTGFSLLPQYIPGFGAAVQEVIGQPASRSAAILISSNPEWADSEAALIAEWAARRRNDGTFLIRGTKLLSHQIAAVPGQQEWAPNFTTPREILDALSAIPVSFVILHTTSARLSYPHHALLKAALAGDQAEWEPIDHTQRYLDGLGETHDIEIYRYRKNVAGQPIHYSVDLTKKLGGRFGMVE
jgi:hypothetical protein